MQTSRKSSKTQILSELTYKRFLTGKTQIWVNPEASKSNLNLTGKWYFMFFKKIQGPQAPNVTGVVTLCLLKEKCGDAHTICEEKVWSPENFE